MMWKFDDDWKLITRIVVVTFLKFKLYISNIQTQVPSGIYLESFRNKILEVMRRVES